MEELKLHESEYRFMELIWEAQPVRSMDLARLAAYELGWREVHQLYGVKEAGRPGVCEERGGGGDGSGTAGGGGQRFESETLVRHKFRRLSACFSHRLLLKDRKLTRREADEIQKMIEEAVEDD